MLQTEVNGALHALVALGQLGGRGGGGGGRNSSSSSSEAVDDDAECGCSVRKGARHCSPKPTSRGLKVFHSAACSHCSS